MSDDDEYMARIRKRAEIEDNGDDYEEEDGEDEGGEGGEESEEENEEEDDKAYHQPGQGYDSDEEDSQQEGDDDHAEDAREAALATIKSLPLAERLALMASGADTTSTKRRTNGDRNKGEKEILPRDEAKDEEEDDAKKKGDKHRPKEVSSKKPVGRFRVVVEPKEGARKARDPRFDSAVGKMNYTMFRKAYNFLEDYQSNEIQTLKTALKKNKNPTKALEIKSALFKIQQEKSERYRHDRKTQVLFTKKKEEKNKVAAGKSPFFLKKREKRRLELEDRYEQLAKQGKLEKALAKKRRKNAAKDHRWLPRTRRGMEGEE